MKSNLVDVEDVFVEQARNNPEVLASVFAEALELYENGEYTVCVMMLRTYIVAGDKLYDVADFLNKSEDEALALLDAEDGLPKAHLDRLIEFLQL